MNFNSIHNIIMYRVICRVIEKGNKNNLIRLKDFEGATANDVIAKAQKNYGADPNFQIGFLYVEADGDYKPIAKLDKNLQNQKLFVTKFNGEGNSSYRQAITTYLTWEDMKGWGD